jgi:acetyltransferase-like isoleucine patch superfamily enzyme
VECTAPPNVRLGRGTVITGAHAFRRFFATAPDALVIGEHSTLNGVHFAIGKPGRVRIGDWCVLTGVILLCELEIAIGSYVAMGLNVAIADTDFHPVAPAERLVDAVASSPLPRGLVRPPIVRSPVVIEDDVWVGPNATILKGVRIGAGSVIEPGAMITRDVPPRSRVLGNPARIVGEV